MGRRNITSCCRVESRGMLILLALILATLLAGPIGFIVALFVIVVWAIITGSLRLLFELIALPFRLVGALLRPNR
jgi:hypothetical protein